MAEARRKKRSSPDKADVKLYERLARLLSHIKDLWNGHQSLLRVIFTSTRIAKTDAFITAWGMFYSHFHNFIPTVVL